MRMLLLSMLFCLPVLSGEIISSIDELKAVLSTKLGMQSTNVRKAFRRLDQDYSGTLDRLEFKRFLENLNVHCTISESPLSSLSLPSSSTAALFFLSPLCACV
jgi:Ca2+-binding EF-hand superfamily protein